MYDVVIEVMGGFFVGGMIVVIIVFGFFEGLCFINDDNLNKE